MEWVLAWRTGVRELEVRVMGELLVSFFCVYIYVYVYEISKP